MTLSRQVDGAFIRATLASGRWSVRFIARKFHGTVGEVHKSAGCQNGERCTGSGCRVNG